VTAAWPDRRSPTWPSGSSVVVGVIGDPVRHSLSPLLHNAAFDALGLDWVSVAFPVPAGQVGDALAGMRAFGIRGLSVTMPHKQAAAAGVDQCTPVATSLGVVNCITLTDGKLVGDSTDGAGFLAALERGAGFEPSGRRCVVVGAGGAARAVVLALTGTGAEEVVVVNRSPVHAEEAAALAGPAGRVGSEADIAGADLVVQATPVGMTGVDAGGRGRGSTPFDPDSLRAGQLVVDLVYYPAVTPLMAAASARGAATLGGLGMLVHQAALAIERWTGQPAPVEAMWAAAGSGVGETAPTGG
jgi:shikimate dehydrogenase